MFLRHSPSPSIPQVLGSVGFPKRRIGVQNQACGATRGAFEHTKAWEDHVELKFVGVFSHAAAEMANGAHVREATHALVPGTQVLSSKPPAP